MNASLVLNVKKATKHKVTHLHRSKRHSKDLLLRSMQKTLTCRHLVV